LLGTWTKLNVFPKVYKGIIIGKRAGKKHRDWVRPLDVLLALRMPPGIKWKQEPRQEDEDDVGSTLAAAAQPSQELPAMILIRCEQSLDDGRRDAQVFFARPPTLAPPKQVPVRKAGKPAEYFDISIERESPSPSPEEEETPDGEEPSETVCWLGNCNPGIGERVEPAA
jgi:hypothetical protein